MEEVRMNGDGTLPRLLSHRRSELGKKCREIALQLEMPSGQLGHIENGLYIPADDKLVAIAKAYDLNIEAVTQAARFSRNLRMEEKNKHRRPRKSLIEKSKKSELDLFPGSISIYNGQDVDQVPRRPRYIGYKGSRY